MSVGINPMKIRVEETIYDIPDNNETANIKNTGCWLTL